MDQAEGVWVTLGVDASVGATPERFLPGLGLRPGGERPDLEGVVAALAAGLFGSIASHARPGLNVVADLGLHDAYASPLHLRAEAARRLTGLPVLFVGVHCPLAVIWERRAATWGQPKEDASDEQIEAVERWQDGGARRAPLRPRDRHRRPHARRMRRSWSWRG